MPTRILGGGGPLTLRSISEAIANTNYITDEIDSFPDLVDIGFEVNVHELLQLNEYRFLGTVNMAFPLYVPPNTTAVITANGLAIIRWIRSSPTIPLFFLSSGCTLHIKFIQMEVLPSRPPPHLLFGGDATDSIVTIESCHARGFSNFGTISNAKLFEMKSNKEVNIIDSEIVITDTQGVEITENLFESLPKPLHVISSDRIQITGNTFKKDTPSSPPQASLKASGNLGDLVVSNNASRPPNGEYFMDVDILSSFDNIHVTDNPFSDENLNTSFFKPGLRGGITGFSDNLAGGTTVSSAGHTLVNGDGVRVESSPVGYISPNGYTIFNVVPSVSFDIPVPFISDGIGQWKTGIDQDTPGVNTFHNEKIANSSNVIDIGDSDNLLVTGFGVNNPSPIVATFLQLKTPQRFVSSTDGVITYIGKRPVDLRFTVNLTGNTDLGKNLYKFYLAVNGSVIPLQAYAQSAFVEKDAQNNIGVTGSVALNTGDNVQAWVEAVGHTRDFIAESIIVSIFGVI